MKRNSCAACNATENLHYHHLVPRSKGGSNKEQNLITLCIRCHGLWHNATWDHDHKALVRDGLEKAREEGVRLGPKPVKIGKPSSYLKKGDQPIDDVIFCLFHIDMMPVYKIKEMSWGELTVFKDVYSDTTEQMIDRAVNLHTYSRKVHFNWPISLNQRGEVRYTNALTQKIGRMRKFKNSDVFPFQLSQLDPVKAKKRREKESLRKNNKKILKINKEKRVTGEGVPEKLQKLVDLI